MLWEVSVHCADNETSPSKREGGADDVGAQAMRVHYPAQSKWIGPPHPTHFVKAVQIVSGRLPGEVNEAREGTRGLHSPCDVYRNVGKTCGIKAWNQRRVFRSEGHCDELCGGWSTW
jgi:hypothetical protein